MSRPRIRKARPQHHADECVDCDGVGLTRSEDWDEYGPRIVMVRCEGCDGSGWVTSCDGCDEVMPLPEAEMLGYVCGPCRADAERGDDEAEAARIRRVG